MRKFGIHTFVILTVLIGLFSCNKTDFLTPSNLPQAPWTDLGSFERAAIAPYNYMANPENAGWETAVGNPVFLDLASSDLGTLSSAASAANAPISIYSSRQFRGLAILNGDPKGGERQYTTFKNMYMMINACNDALGFINKAGNGEIFPGVLTSDPNVKRIKAELLFNRARAYFILAQEFLPPYIPQNSQCDSTKKLIPFKTEFTSNVDSLRKPTLGSAKDVYALIKSDLKKAKANMPTSYNVEGRANINAIRAELVRVEFLSGDYLNAKLECDTILNSAKYPLQSNPLDAWTKAPGDLPASEVIMEFVPNTTTAINDLEVSIVSRANPWGIKGQRGYFWNMCSWVAVQMSGYFLQETGWEKDPLNGDASVGANASIDKRYLNLYKRLEAYSPNPYQTKDSANFFNWQNTYMTMFPQINTPTIWLDKYFRGVSGFTTKEPLYRSAEFNLTRAAILCKLNLPDGNGYDVNLTRVRAGLPKLVRSNYNQTQWMTEIGRERMREMGPESGDRTRYLMSTRQPILWSDGTPDNVNGLPPYSNWYFRIPEEEVNSDAAYPPGFTQN